MLLFKVVMLEKFFWKAVPITILIVLAVLGFWGFGRVTAGRSVTDARNEVVTDLDWAETKKYDSGGCFRYRTESVLGSHESYCDREAYLVVPVPAGNVTSAMADLHAALVSQGCSELKDISGSGNIGYEDSTTIKPGLPASIRYDWQSGNGSCELVYLPRGTETDRFISDDISGALEAVSAGNQPVAVVSFYKVYWTPRQILYFFW
jgi:hypothetical protein